MKAHLAPGEQAGPGGRDRTAARRDLLVVALTVTTGAVDAVTFLHLGKVFSSVITGNLALLGVAAGSHDASLAVNGGVALGGYAAGGFAGGAIAGAHEPGQQVWPARVTAALSAELAVLIGFSLGWLVTEGRPAGTVQLTLLSLCAAAMGMQSAAVRRLGQMSSTYLTSTLTGLVVALALRQRSGGHGRSVGVLAAIVAGAVAGAVASSNAAGWAPAVILVPLIAVLATAPGRSRTGRGLPSAELPADLPPGGSPDAGPPGGQA